MQVPEDHPLACSMVECIHTGNTAENGRILAADPALDTARKNSDLELASRHSLPLPYPLSRHQPREALAWWAPTMAKTMTQGSLKGFRQACRVPF